METEQLSPGQWREFREIRLASLADTPEAFSSTLEEARRLSEDDWRTRLASRAQFVARWAGRPVGTVGVSVWRETPELVSMWVDPDWRGRGVGDALVSAALKWAERAGHPVLRLWVTAENYAAQRLYIRHGFRATGAVQPVRPETPDRQELEMRRVLAAVRALR